MKIFYAAFKPDKPIRGPLFFEAPQLTTLNPIKTLRNPLPETLKEDPSTLEERPSNHLPFISKPISRPIIHIDIFISLKPRTIIY